MSEEREPTCSTTVQGEDSDERSSLRAQAPQLFPDILRARAQMQPDGVALVVDDVGALTYRDWERRSNAFARGLVGCGVHPGERVGLLFDNRRWLDYAVAFFGTLRAGAVAVPLPSGLPRVQIDTILSHSGALGLCCPPDLVPEHGSVPTWGPADLEGAQAQDQFQVAIEPDALAQILYTSGTTGLPKGVACSHANLLFGIVTDGPELGAARVHQVALHALPIGVNAAQVELTRAAHRIATTVILPSFDPERFATLVDNHRASVLLLVPAMAIMMVNVGAFDRHDASSVRRIRLTGAPSPPALLRRLAEAMPQSQITNEYALTESAPLAITTIYDPTRPASVGRPDPGEIVQITGEGGKTCRPREVGEIWLSRPGAPTRSYYRDPEGTAAVFAGGWIRTGDLGYLDEEGFLHLTDRKSDLIITGGRNVSSLEVAAVLHECPAVAEAAVIGMPHEVLGECVAAAVVLRTPTAPSDLKAFARHRLPEYAVPHTVLFVDRLPRGISGKVLKTELRVRLASEPTRDFIVPRTPTEVGLAAIWARVLGLETVGVNDRFVDLGGQSVSAVQVVTDIERRYGVSLEPTVLTGAETVAALAAVLETALHCNQDESFASAESEKMPYGVLPDA